MQPVLTPAPPPGSLLIPPPPLSLLQDAKASSDLFKLQAQVANKQADFDTRKRARLTEEFQSDKDNSKKAFYKEFKKVVELADVVIQVG
jgi:nuclear GTP-binding protein